MILGFLVLCQPIGAARFAARVRGAAASDEGSDPDRQDHHSEPSDERPRPVPWALLDHRPTPNIEPALHGVSPSGVGSGVTERNRGG